MLRENKQRPFPYLFLSNPSKLFNIQRIKKFRWFGVQQAANVDFVLISIVSKKPHHRMLLDHNDPRTREQIHYVLIGLSLFQGRLIIKYLNLIINRVTNVFNTFSYL